MNADIQHKVNEAKALILAKVSYSRAAKQVGMEPLDLLNRLRGDKDIAAARDQGLLNKPRNTSKRSDYGAMPWVVDVLKHGLTQVEAAKKYDLSQPYVSKCVRKAREHPPTTTTISEPPLVVGIDPVLALKVAAEEAKKRGVSASEIVQAVVGVICS